MAERIIELIEHLKKTREILSQAEFANKIGIKPSQISEMLSEKRIISERTIRKISQSFPNICNKWLLTGEGEMLKKETLTPTNNSDIVSMPTDVWEVIKNQAESLKTKDKQMDNLLDNMKTKDAEIIEMLKEVLKKGQYAGDSFRVVNQVVVEDE